MSQAPSAPLLSSSPLSSSALTNHILAIDGPAGAGKSTIAARMAARFGLLNIETGAMYRAFALKALAAGIALDDCSELVRLSQNTTIQLLPAETGNRVLLDSEDVTARLRTPDVSEAASRVSVHTPVRAWMVALQQELVTLTRSGTNAGANLETNLGANPETIYKTGHETILGIVMEGRDIGTVVFPEASLKIFLFASPEARTERRLAQGSPTLEEQAAIDAASLLAAIHERDERDRSRAESPLRQAEDSIAIDSTMLTLEQVTSRIEALITERWHLQPR